MQNSLKVNSVTTANITDPARHGVAAFAALIRPFERAIYLAALALVNEPEEALEIAQETVVRAFKSAAKMCPLQQFKAWMIATAIEQARAFLRDKKRINIDEVFADDEVSVCDFRRDPRSLTRALSADALAKAVSRLPLRDRLVLFLRDVLLLTTTEAATIIGISERTVRLRLARARFGLCDIVMLDPADHSVSKCSGTMAAGQRMDVFAHV
jgi:RNA polymerase sigma-70 factor, ECF subfamily